ncbi:MAG TPA: HWE histidine kinase domain-containing protein [Phenylobacterium sp.]
MADPEALFRTAFYTSPRPLLLIAADAPKFTMLAVNAAHAGAFGTTPEALEGLGVLEVFGPAPTGVALEFREAIRTSLTQAIQSRRPDQMPVRPYALRSETGDEERYWSAVNSPICDVDGEVTHLVSAVQDVTGEVQERRSEQARRLLMREVDHRARNTLTMVQTLVRMTLADDIRSYRNALDGRIEALARAQTSLAARRWEGASLAEVLEGELCPLVPADRLTLSGPPVMLPHHQVQAASMVVHELATNALKYGALAAPSGRLAVDWIAAPDHMVTITWAETGLVELQPPARVGFGSRLLTQLGRQLGGGVELDWRPHGLCARLSIDTKVQPHL